MSMAIVGALLLDARSETPLGDDTLVVGQRGRRSCPVRSSRDPVVNGDPLAEPQLWSDPARVIAVIQAGRVVADRR